MRIVQVTEFGGPEVLAVSEAPEPSAGPGQVVVDVLVAPVLFLDTQIRSGSARDWFAATLPYVPGADLRAEEWVLALGAGGGLGSLLIQLAHNAGARVIGAARGKEKLNLAQESGADAVVDYSESGWPEQILAVTGGAGPSTVFDGVGGEIGKAAFAITALGGRFSAHGAPSGGFAQIDRQEAERRDQTFPLKRAADAHPAIEARDVIGKTLLVI
jgi:NADPH2:quinone reductase